MTITKYKPSQGVSPNFQEINKLEKSNMGLDQIHNHELKMKLIFKNQKNDGESQNVTISPGQVKFIRHHNWAK